MHSSTAPESYDILRLSTGIKSSHAFRQLPISRLHFTNLGSSVRYHINIPGGTDRVFVIDPNLVSPVCAGYNGDLRRCNNFREGSAFDPGSLQRRLRCRNKNTSGLVLSMQVLADTEAGVAPSSSWVQKILFAFTLKP